MSVDLSKGATVELVKTLSDDLRTKNDGTKHSSAGAGMRLLEVGVKNVKNASLINEETAFANPLIFSDGADDVPVKDCVVNIQPNQPNAYDSVWVAGAGKNKVDPSVTPMNAYIRASNGEIVGSGNDRVVVYPVEPNTTYTFTMTRMGQISGQQTDDSQGVAFTGDTKPDTGSIGRVIYSATGNTSVTFTTSDTEKWFAFKVANITRSSYTDTLATAQLEKGSTATAYTPYSNICPISGWTEADVVRSANIFNFSNIQIGKNWIGGNASNRAYGTTPWTAGTKYYFKVPSLPDGIVISCLDIDAAIGGTQANMFELTASQTEYEYTAVSSFIGLQYQTLSNNFVFTQDFIDSHRVIVSTAPITTYSVDLSSAGTVYGGTLDVTTGVLTVTKALVTIPTITTIATSGTGTGKYIGFTVSEVGNPSIAPIAECGNGTLFAQRGNAYEFYLSANGSSIQCFVPSDASVSDVNDAIEGRHVVYDLATPQTYQLTPTEVTTLLKNNTLTANCGTVSLSYYADTKKYIEEQTASISDISDMIAPTEETYTATRAYTVNDLLIVKGTLYKVTANISNGATITVGTNVQQTTLSALIKEALSA